ncbi:MAG: adenosine deaminase family protein [Acidimicrobiales bacterium]
MARLARRHRHSSVPTDADAVRDYLRFTSFEHFITVYAALNALVTTGADIADLVAGAAYELAAQHVRYAEMTVTPYSHVAAGIAYPEVLEGLAEGRRRARAAGVTLAWIYDIPGECGADAADSTAAFATEHPPDGLVAFGLGGVERGVERAAFAGAFGRARAAGLRSVPHAGEADGPASVWAALNALGADRIGHGIRSIEDPDLMAHLVEHQVPLEVCPSSNVCTGVVASLGDHPIEQLMHAGVAVTVNSDAHPCSPRPSPTSTSGWPTSSASPRPTSPGCSPLRSVPASCRQRTSSP